MSTERRYLFRHNRGLLILARVVSGSVPYSNFLFRMKRFADGIASAERPVAGRLRVAGNVSIRDRYGNEHLVGNVCFSLVPYHGQLMSFFPVSAQNKPDNAAPYIC
ncbi:hypothetical protein GWI33_000006 [Rhynchophorus ferrugineus]|uniref:Uncharacterized protein n=1 Tax=Rhynchophorus ferrugineus TaxID=354439 RepID=A0A834MM86_RHYFE|nr:hypothetical protein GWI33_000006 [Rhynchophorus ferrugineus]